MTEPPEETNDELLERYRHVREKLIAATKTRDRLRPGGARDRKSRWCGSLNFTLISIEAELQSRGMRLPS